MLTASHVLDIASHFSLEQPARQAVPVTTGHINDTWLVTTSGPQRGLSGPPRGGSDPHRGRTSDRFILQRINQAVFKQPRQVMENIAQVTAHLRERIRAAGGDPWRETLTLVPLRGGGLYYTSAEDEIWRAYPFIENAEMCPLGADLRQVFQAAAAFGRFQALLEDLPGGRLAETIPDFHHTPKRIAAFERAAEADAAGRLSGVRAEVEAVLARASRAGRVVSGLEQGELPKRVTHNDTKLDNVMLDSRDGRGLCVIDLDTVMPGSLVYDFGDMVRMGASAAAEDEPDLNKVTLDLARFEQLTLGYLGQVAGLLAPAEWELLVFGAWLITYEQAARFLGDYLNGDTYYKTDYAGHNLVRARTQIKMVEEFEANWEKMEGVVRKAKG